MLGVLYKSIISDFVSLQLWFQNLGVRIYDVRGRDNLETATKILPQLRNKCGSGIVGDSLDSFYTIQTHSFNMLDLEYPVCLGKIVLGRRIIRKSL